MKKKNLFKDAKKSLLFMALIAVLILVFFCVSAFFTAMGYEASAKADGIESGFISVISAENGNASDAVIVLDAGHGGEDPGAINGELLEKNLNLDITLKLAEMFSATGYKVVLTRDTDNLLYEAGQEKNKKQYDLLNRLKIAEQYGENCVFVSIHMNKFPLESCSGLQTFYSSNNEKSKSLAELIQKNSVLVQPDNHRKIKLDNSLYLLERSAWPTVIVECGFISNLHDAASLSDESYQKNLAFTIFCSITEFLSE